VTLPHIVKKRESRRLWQVIRKAVKKIKKKIKEKKSEMFLRASSCSGYFIKQFNEDNHENQKKRGFGIWRN